MSLLHINLCQIRFVDCPRRLYCLGLVPIDRNLNVHFRGTSIKSKSVNCIKHYSLIKIVYYKKHKVLSVKYNRCIVRPLICFISQNNKMSSSLKLGLCCNSLPISNVNSPINTHLKEL